MPVARSVSASQLTRGEEDSVSAAGPVLLTPKAHTLDRFAKPSAMNGHGDSRRKRPFMSFRLSKKSSKSKESGSGGGPMKTDISQNPGGIMEPPTVPSSTITENGADSVDGGSDSSSASVKPKKKYLTRMSSFVSRVASKVQGTPTVPGGVQRGKLERSKTISVSDLQTKVEAYVEYDEGKVPGVMGIRNHGNTCFINAVIQCLNHTDFLAEYFVLDHYKHDLARCNKINSKKYGTRGEITEQLAVLLKALWTLRYVPDLSMNFKNTVDKFESIYRGSQQHDAAEFLMFVLDKVHEDLNTASKRKYKKIKNTYGRPDEVVAAETLANHLRCNSSFIHDIFQAQFRSSLKCPHCQKESNTFDPFLCVSIPIPQRQIQSIFVCVVYLNQQPKQVQLGVSIEASATVRELRKQLADDCGISADSLIITEVDGEGFHRTFSDGALVNVICENDPVYAIELPTHKPPTQENGAFILITWVNVVLADPENIRFGGVYQSQVVRDISYVDLQKLLLKEMTTMVTTDTLTSEQESGLFLIGVDDGGSCVVCLDPALDVPLFHECVEQALALCDPQAGPPHVKLILQWTSETKEKYIVDDVDHVEEHFSVKELKENPQQCASVSLHQCLQLHTSAEKLGCGDAWHCPTCNRKQQVVKRLMLWSAPQILVIHLKRFRQGTLQSNSSKLSTTVKFPLTGFDISEHVASKPNNQHHSSSIESSVLGGVWSPWKRPKRFLPHNEDNVYDLYAVCYHHGKDMQGGHYTATCKNTADNKWYSFDDSKVEVAAEDEVVNPDAYILFYQRRNESGVLGYFDGGSQEHWAHKIPLAYLPPSLTQANKENKAPPPFERGRSYGTLPINSRTPRQASTEREHASDTEAPLASHEESPILKRRSTSTLHEADDSPTDDTSKSSLKIETIKVDVLPSQDAVEDTEEKMECDSVPSSQPEEDQDMPDTGKSSNRTVMISQSQSLRSTGSQDSVDSSAVQPVMNGHAEDTAVVASDEESDGAVLPHQQSEGSQEELTPEVRIHPATPEVLAAHQGHGEGQAKHSVITLTFRPRHPSDSSSETRVKVMTGSSSSLTNGVVVNGVDSHHLSSDEDLPHSSTTPEVRITPMNTANEALMPRQPAKMSTRCMNSNKTASFVVVNTPTVSPRAPRPKTPVTNGYSSSPRPYSVRNGVKHRDPPAEAVKTPRSLPHRRENGVVTKQPKSITKSQNLLTPTNYCSSVQTGVGMKNYRVEKEIWFSRDSKCDKRDSSYDREEQYERSKLYDHEVKYDHDIAKYENGTKYERDRRYERDHKFNRDCRYESDHSYEKNSIYETDYKYERNGRGEKEYQGCCDLDYRYETDRWCERGYDYKYDSESKCDPDYRYSRKVDFKYNRGDSTYDRHCIYEGEVLRKSRLFENRDHCPPTQFSKGLPNTATNPTVITESSV